MKFLLTPFISPNLKTPPILFKLLPSIEISLLTPRPRQSMHIINFLECEIDTTLYRWRTFIRAISIIQKSANSQIKSRLISPQFY